MHLAPNSFVVSLLKMLTYSAYAENNDFCVDPRLVELLNLHRNRCEIPPIIAGLSTLN